MHMFTQEPVFDIRDYSGQIYYGQSQFYVEPKEPRFVSRGTRPVRLILAGHFWYDTSPRFELGPEVRLTMLANRDLPDTGVEDEAMRAMAAALALRTLLIAAWSHPTVHGRQSPICTQGYRGRAIDL